MHNAIHTKSTKISSANDVSGQMLASVQEAAARSDALSTKLNADSDVGILVTGLTGKKKSEMPVGSHQTLKYRRNRLTKSTTINNKLQVKSDILQQKKYFEIKCR